VVEKEQSLNGSEGLLCVMEKNNSCFYTGVVGFTLSFSYGRTIHNS